MQTNVMSRPSVNTALRGRQSLGVGPTPNFLDSEEMQTQAVSRAYVQQNIQSNVTTAWLQLMPNLLEDVDIDEGTRQKIHKVRFAAVTQI